MRVKKPEIIFEDQDMLVCRKPAGIAVQTSKAGQQDMVSILKNYRASKKEDVYIGTVHRLDQPVEGVMVFAKTKTAAAKLSKQVADKQADKYYLAVTEGRFEQTAGTLEHDLVRDGRTNLSHVAAPGERGAKHAKLTYQVLAYDAGMDESLVKIKLDTGRHHQIRVQMATVGHPLIGDRKYNPKADQGNVALCSCKIAVEHPATGEKMEFTVNPKNPFFAPFPEWQDKNRGF